MEACSCLTPAKANLSFSNGNIPGLAGFLRGRKSAKANQPWEARILASSASQQNAKRPPRPNAGWKRSDSGPQEWKKKKKEQVKKALGDAWTKKIRASCLQGEAFVFCVYKIKM